MTAARREDFRRVRAIPTTYAGVRMRSRLEARCARVLDTIGIPWRYEPFVVYVPGQRGSGYLPDFQLWPGAATPWFVEIKPTAIYGRTHADPSDLTMAVDKLGRVRHSRPDATLVLWLADPRHVDMGVVLIHVASTDEWVRRPAIAFLVGAHRAQPGRPSVWTRVLSLRRRQNGR